MKSNKENKLKTDLDLESVILKINSGKNPLTINFDSLNSAILFSYSIYNQRRKLKIGNDLKVSVDKVNNSVIILKKTFPNFNLI